jgi:hypothetical protein
MSTASLRAIWATVLLFIVFAATATLAAQRDVPQAFTNGLSRKDCVSGADAQNPTPDPSGLTLPENRVFSTIEEAQAFVCFRIPYPRDTEGWQFQAANALRSHDLGTLLQDARGFRRVMLGYDDGHDGSLLRIEVIYGSIGEVSGGGGEEQTTIHGAPATIATGGPFPAFMGVHWEEGSVGFLATASLTPEFTREDVLRILESIR